MIIYTIANITVIGSLFFFLGSHVMIAFIIAAVIGILLLETVNYIEHYGLVRRMLDTGRYERVETIHSWNSDHLLGRYLLFELTRHGHHHENSLKTYPELNMHQKK